MWTYVPRVRPVSYLQSNDECATNVIDPALGGSHLRLHLPAPTWIEDDDFQNDGQEDMAIGHAGPSSTHSTTPMTITITIGSLT
jgi:hypothetical protein